MDAALCSSGLLLASAFLVLYKRVRSPRHHPLDHVVLLRCKHNAWDEQNLKARIEALAQSIPGVLDITCGPTYSTTRNSGFTHGLVARLSSKEALATYAIHAKHLEVKAYILKALQPLLTRESSDGSGTVTLPPVLAVDYHSTRYPGTALGQRSDKNSVSHIVLICLRPHCPTRWVPHCFRWSMLLLLLLLYMCSDLSLSRVGVVVASLCAVPLVETWTNGCTKRLGRWRRESQGCVT